MFCEIENSITELVNTYVQKHQKSSVLFTSWDCELIKKWEGICLPANGSQTSVGEARNARAHTVWQTPQLDFAKINFDGALRGNPNESGAGVCIRNNLGEFLALKYSSLPQETNNLAEAQAPLYGLSLAKK